jgi:hypothetical protein
MNIDFATNYIIHVMVTNGNKQIAKHYATYVPRNSTFRMLFEQIAGITNIPESHIMSHDSATGATDTFNYDQLLQNVYGDCKTLTINIEDVREMPMQVFKPPQNFRNTRKSKEFVSEATLPKGAKKELVM